MGYAHNFIIKKTIKPLTQSLWIEYNNSGYNNSDKDLRTERAAVALC